MFHLNVTQRRIDLKLIDLIVKWQVLEVILGPLQLEQK